MHEEKKGGGAFVKFRKSERIDAERRRGFLGRVGKERVAM